jgi:hypothetical protein
MLYNQYLAPTRQEALKAHKLFVQAFGEKYPKAVKCLVKERGPLRLLRLPRHPLAASTYNQSHRVHIRHRAVASPKGQGLGDA